ncbi:MAG TPA: RluA family pseudouridine synthase [Solirubrobacteraceae bacterium]|nr:RluA family pseudouridine synthase [Solirubrobacteraceae bacterium]
MPQGRSELTVAEHEAGVRLDQFLAGPLGSRAQAQAAIEAGRVTVDGARRAKRHVVQPGELVAVEPPEIQPVAGADSEAPFEVVYEDEFLLVVDKPAGVVVHPARGHATGTLAQALAGRAAGGDEPWRAGIVHRLDRDTSGLLVVAKTEEVHRALKSLLARRRLTREYLALVEGHPPARTGEIDAPIGRDRRDRLKVSIDTDQPRAARTHFEVAQLLPETALLRVTLDTGRTHQIRVHLAAIGHPVCGDRLYGRSDSYGLERQFLHADRLSFPHPVTGAPIEAMSPLPADLRRALERARE